MCNPLIYIAGDGEISVVMKVALKIVSKVASKVG